MNRYELVLVYDKILAGLLWKSEEVLHAPLSVNQLRLNVVLREDAAKRAIEQLQGNLLSVSGDLLGGGAAANRLLDRVVYIGQRHVICETPGQDG